MASLYRRGEYWYIAFYYDGKKIKKSLQTKSLTLARQIKTKFESDLITDKFNLSEFKNKSKSLVKFTDEAIRYAQTNKAQSTAIREKRVLNDFLKFAGDISLKKINARFIEQYKNHLIKKGFKPAGINLQLRHLSSAFSMAVKFNYLSKNPFKGIKKIPVPKRKPIFLSKEQANKLLEATKGKTIYPYILISLNTGARAEEVVRLEWKDIDLKNRILKLYGKGSKERAIPINDKLLKFLNQYSGKSFKKTIRPDNVSKLFRTEADRLGLHEFTFHSLRHTFASWLAQSGMSLKIIQELLGHEDIKTTMIYAHLIPDNKIAAVKLIDHYFSVP